MANTTLNTRVICKVDTAAKWASSSLVLLKGEIAIEADTRKFKIGDGVKTFSQLEYAAQLPTKISTQNPSVTDTGYEVGSLWMNSTDGSTYILQTNDAEPTWVKLAKFSDLAAGDFGDMHARDYDTDGNGSVDKADTLKNSDGSFLSVNDSNTDGLWTASKTNQTITEGLALKADKSDTYTWTTAFLEELKKRRKFAIRLGEMSDQMYYNIRPEITKKLLLGKITLDQLTEKDFSFVAQQKGVDMRIGIDIASMTYKHQVDQIILIAGDSDFVPAAKMARREGIDFILDPLWADIRPNLFEHIDGLCSMWKKTEKDENQTE